MVARHFHFGTFDAAPSRGVHAITYTRVRKTGATSVTAYYCPCRVTRSRARIPGPERATRTPSQSPPPAPAITRSSAPVHSTGRRYQARTSELANRAGRSESAPEVGLTAVSVI